VVAIALFLAAVAILLIPAGRIGSGVVPAPETGEEGASATPAELRSAPCSWRGRGGLAIGTKLTVAAGARPHDRSDLHLRSGIRVRASACGSPAWQSAAPIGTSAT
jgi:hypothetical protein